MSFLTESIERYYSSQEMDERVVDRILSGGKRKRRIALVRRYALAALLALSVIGAGLEGGRYILVQKAFEEVAANHLKAESPAFLTDDFGELEHQLSSLGMPLQPEAEWFSERYALVGGKYCSLLGEPAAQVKVRDNATGGAATLYIVPRAGRVALLRDADRKAHGLSTRAWREDGRFFVLAGER